ncbi:glycosyltransferase family 2 protein [Succiniclasticum sp.]|uniref:glycosyltransferase family 2 protein n=1 Tax=Succiniclasticum sp. TaxID=2775030 RepID=UPI0034DB2BD6
MISVIVPIYKVEDVLSRCLDSLCRQSLQDIEIILVDDASPDRCGEICERYAAEDARFKVIHHPENRGLSAARNTGIAHASADYLMFVDSDDWVHEDFCKLPYECVVKQQADLVLFCYQSIDKKGSLGLKWKAENRGSGKLTRLEAIELMLSKIGVTAWNKLYARKLFQTVSYPEGCFYEDKGTTYKTVLMADTIYYLDSVLYYHCYHEGSITTLKTEKLLQDYFEMSMQQYRDLLAWGYPEDKRELLLHNIALAYCIRKKSDVDDTNYVFCRKILQSAEQILKGFTRKRKVLFVLLKYCPPLFELVCIIFGKKVC